jgi:hypothetical protein
MRGGGLPKELDRAIQDEGAYCISGDIVNNTIPRAAATRLISVPLLGHALHVCTTGVVKAAGVRWRWAKPDLAWVFGSPGHVGAVLRKPPAFFHSCGP